MFRCPWTWSFLVILAFGTALPAQEELPESASIEMIDNALRGLRLAPNRQNQVYTFTLENRRIQLFRLENGARVLLKASSAARPALETLNRYNEQVAVTTRAVRYPQEPTVLEAGLDCRLGVSEVALRRFILGFSRDMQLFEQYLAKQDQKIDGPKEQTRPQVVEQPASIPLNIIPGTDDKEIEITFPAATGEAGETAWKILWDIENGDQANKQGFKFPKSRKNSLLLFKIKKAYFRPGAKADWIQVLEDAHASEFYVPYYFQNTRFFDLRDVGNYVRLNAREGGPRSQLLGKQQLVMAELRDRGLAYKHGHISRRAEELTLWANFQAGNYTYLVEFGFQDDGTIAFRHAPTGYNYFSHFETASHMHNCLWRIGVRLAPADSPIAQTQVQIVRLPFDPKGQGPAGKLDIQDMPTEGFLDWEPREFTKLRVLNPAYSVFPEDEKTQPSISYDLVPLVQGLARHARHKDEGFSQHDFWVTRPDSPEKMYINLHNYFRKVGQPRQLHDSDGVVLWHMSSALHVPRGEDGILAGNNLNNGQALVGWTVVELRPRNLFTRTPLYKTK